jgi:predicted porin
MKRKLVFAATLLSFAGVAAHADEVTDLKAEAKALQRQNEALNKRLAAIEQRQKAMDVNLAASRQRALDANAAGVIPTKAVPYTSTDDSLCWHGLCMYGVVDMGFGWEAHGMPFNGSMPTGVLYTVGKFSNRPMFEASPNGLTQSFVGLTGETEILPGVNAIFKMETGFDPFSGQLANGLGSIQQNNGLNPSTYSANADAGRAGQAINGQLYAGVSSALFGTLTFGRQNTLLLDQILGYDAMGAAYAFSPIGISGVFGGGGDSEDARLDQTIKYRWGYGPIHAGAMYQVGNYGSGGTTMWPHDEASGNIGFSYLGFSADGTYSKVRGAVNVAAPLMGAANVGNPTLSATISDNSAWMATAKYKWDRFEVMAGYENITLADPRNAVTAGLNDDGYVMSTVNNAAFPNDKVLQMMWIGGKYKATDNLTLIGSYYHDTQNSYGAGALVGCSTNVSSFCSGSLNVVSFVADYVFNKHFDIYAGLEYSKVNGGLSSGYMNTWNIDPMAGARYSF